MTAGDPELPPIDIRPQDWTILRTLLRRHLPQHEVWAFGSRVTGRAKPFSDLDLVVIADTPLSLDERAALAEALSESGLPWTVDLLDWATTSPVFRRLIEAEHRLIPTTTDLDLFRGPETVAGQARSEERAGWPGRGSQRTQAPESGPPKGPGDFGHQRRRSRLVDVLSTTPSSPG
jgi:type I restriction enzyme S subunit